MHQLVCKHVNLLCAGGSRAECCCYNSTAFICSYGLVQYISHHDFFSVALLDSPLCGFTSDEANIIDLLSSY